MPTQNTENNYIENWVKSNETRLTEIRNGNPELYGAVNGVLNYINNYLGNTNPIQEIVSKEPLIPATPENVALNEDNWKDFDFFNTKIYVNTFEKSEKFQRLIFELGGSWGNAGAVVKKKYSYYLFVDDMLRLSYGDDRVYFDQNPKKEIFYDDIFPISTGVKQADTLKVGDKVKLPKTRRGKTDNSNVIKNALIRNQDFLYVTDVVKNRVYLSFDNSDANEEAFVLDEDKIELYEEKIETFKVGDFVVGGIWNFPMIITKLDSGNGQFECKEANGLNPKDILYLVPDETKLFSKQPKFNVGDKILNPTKQLKGRLSGSAKTLIEKSNNENLGYLVVTEVTYNRYGDEVFNYWLGFQDLPNASVPFLEEDCVLYDAPKPKFKIGEKIVRINGNQLMTVVKQLYDVKQKMFDYDLVFEDGTDVSLFENQLEAVSVEPAPEPKFKLNDLVVIKGSSEPFKVIEIETDILGKFYYNLESQKRNQSTIMPESQLEAISTQPATELDPNNFQWEQIWGSGLTPETLVTNYKKYVKLKGKIAPYDAEQLVESFGELSVIVDTYTNSKNYESAHNYYLSKQPTSSKEKWNIFRFKLKPEYEGIFKNFKKLTDTFEMGNALIFKVENRTKFNQFLEAILREDLLYNSLTIPDLILGKKTNSITVTQQEQSEFDDLLDELDNLEL